MFCFRVQLRRCYCAKVNILAHAANISCEIHSSFLNRYFIGYSFEKLGSDRTVQGVFLMMVKSLRDDRGPLDKQLLP